MNPNRCGNTSSVVSSNNGGITFKMTLFSRPGIPFSSTFWRFDGLLFWGIDCVDFVDFFSGTFFSCGSFLVGCSLVVGFNTGFFGLGLTIFFCVGGGFVGFFSWITFFSGTFFSFVVGWILEVGGRDFFTTGVDFFVFVFGVGFSMIFPLFSWATFLSGTFLSGTFFSWGIFFSWMISFSCVTFCWIPLFFLPGWILGGGRGGGPETLEGIFSFWFVCFSWGSLHWYHIV